LFIRDEKMGRRAFNAQALKALGIDPSEAREPGYLFKEQVSRDRDKAACDEEASADSVCFF
jgi:hypothetical protein